MLPGYWKIPEWVCPGNLQPPVVSDLAVLVLANALTFECDRRWRAMVGKSFVDIDQGCFLLDARAWADDLFGDKKQKFCKIRKIKKAVRELAEIGLARIEKEARSYVVIRATVDDAIPTVKISDCPARVAPSNWTALRAEVFERDKFTCQYCGCQEGPFECDHVVPVSKGGGHDLDNLKTACKPCNRSKGSKMPVSDADG